MVRAKGVDLLKGGRAGSKRHDSQRQKKNERAPILDSMPRLRGEAGKTGEKEENKP
jgi:hypothetical protein